MVTVRVRHKGFMMFSLPTLLVSTGVVALGEMGDKTQLLAFILAAKFRKPIPIILGIFVATIVNHSTAGALGAWITSLVEPQTMRWILAASFIGMGLWTLIPDKLDEEDAKLAHFGVFATTVIAFFLAEMGDKTQIATVALAAKYPTDLLSVVIGTTAGMMIADVPAVLFARTIAQKVPLNLVHGIAAVIFIAIGVVTLFWPS